MNKQDKKLYRAMALRDELGLAIANFRREWVNVQLKTKKIGASGQTERQITNGTEGDKRNNVGEKE